MTNEVPLGEWLTGQPVVLLALAGLLAAALGWKLEASGSRLGDRLRTAGYVAIGLAGMLIVVDAARKADRSDAALELVGRSQAEVVGGETVIPLGADGHFRAVAQVNGQDLSVMIDTGATYTSIEEATARKLNIAADPSRPPTELGTANGTISARFGLADELRLGAINARKVTVIIIPDTNRPVAVIGMDLLSRLEGWRVENDKLILSPPRQ